MKGVLEIPRTAMEVFEMLPEGTLCEVIDNALYISPSPTPHHQRLSVRISTLFEMVAMQNNAFLTFAAPCDVYLDGGETVVQPDVFIIKAEREYIIEAKGVKGSPDVVIEILSHNARYDKETKLKVYERNGIPKYFIVDPETKEVWRYLLIDGTYALQTGTMAGKLNTVQLGLEINF